MSATAMPWGNSQQAYSSRNKPPPLSELLPYRPRQINRRSRLFYEWIRAAELQRQLGRPFSYTEKILASRVAQLCGLERRTTRGGRDSIDHAPGQHDDVCNAALGALLAASTRSAPLILSNEALQQFRAVPDRDR